MTANRVFSYRHVAVASLSNAAFFGLQSLVFLALTPATLQSLGKEVYGLWIIMLALLGFSNLAQFGTDIAVTKYTAQYSVGDQSRRAFSAAITFSYVFVLLSSIGIALILWVSRFWIAHKIEATPEVAALLPSVFGLLAVGIIPGFLFSVSRGILLGLLHNNAVNAIDVGTNVALWIGALAIGLQGGNVIILVWLIVIVNVVRLLWGTALSVRATRNYNLYPVLDADISRGVLRFSLVSWITSLGATLFQSVDRLLVGMILGPSTAATYGIATGVAARLTGLTSKVSQALMPFSSAQDEAGYRQRVVSALRYSNRLISCVSLIISGVMIIWMDKILHLWISPDFAAANSSVFRLIVVCYAISSVALPSQQVAQGMGWLILPAAVYLGGGLLMNLLIWRLAPVWNLAGVAVANLVSTSLLLIPVYLARKLQLSISSVSHDLGIPILVFLVVVIISVVSDSLPMRMFSTCVLVGTMLWLALGGNRSKALGRAMRGV